MRTALVGFGVVKFHHSCSTQTSLLKQLFSQSVFSLSGSYRRICFLLNSSSTKAVHLMLCMVVNVSDFLAIIMLCLGVGWQPHNEAQHLNTTTKKSRQQEQPGSQR